MADRNLATGSELTADTFADFVRRLRYHVRGEGVDDHCTADALFVVQSREIIFGIDRDYTDKTAVAVEDSMYFSPQEYWDEHEDMHARLDSAAHEVGEMPFLSLEEYEQWDILAELPEHTVSGWDERWDYVNSHFTKEAAEAFIRRKKHDYRRGLRVYVEAQVYCWEYNAIIKGLLDGRIAFTEPEAARRAISPVGVPAKNNLCVGCEGKPSVENSPCNVCGEGVPAPSQDEPKEQFTLAGYVSLSELEKLDNPRIAGRGMMVSKEPGGNSVAIYVAATTDRSKE